MEKSILLFSAYACDPTTPSEPIAGHAFLLATVNNLEEDEELHVISRLILKDRILSSLDSVNKKNVQFHFIATPKLFAFLEKPGIGINARLGYLVWNHYAKKFLQSQSWVNRVRMAHHATLSSDILPTPLSALPSSTYKIWGPVGSTGNYSVFLLPPYSLGNTVEAIKQLFKNLISGLTGTFFSRQFDLILAQTLKIEEKFQCLGSRSIYFPNQYIPAPKNFMPKRPVDQELFERSISGNRSAEIKVLIVGHFVSGKRIDLGIELMRKTQLSQLSLTIVGSKPKPSKTFLNKWRFFKQVGKLPAKTILMGKLDRESTIGVMSDHDVLLHLSGREGPSFVVGEAITLGLPVVCFEGTGAADTVRSVPGSGLVIPANRKAMSNLENYILEASLLVSETKDIWNLKRIETFLSNIKKEVL